jgi:hypothetical protein
MEIDFHSMRTRYRYVLPGNEKKIIERNENQGRLADKKSAKLLFVLLSLGEGVNLKKNHPRPPCGLRVLE